MSHPAFDAPLLDLQRALAAAGLDLFATCAVEDYDRLVPDDFRLSGAVGHSLAPIAPDDRVVLIGASRVIWTAFTDALAREPERRLEAHPFDRWSSETLAAIVRETLPSELVVDLRMVFEGPPRGFAAQHLAELTGLACRGPAAMSVHPVFGPWFALRAALVLRGGGPPAPPPPAPICERCATRACVPALEHALAASRPAAPVDHGQVRERWRLWLAVRDACPVGREYRYSENQIRWHYAHDRSALV